MSRPAHVVLNALFLDPAASGGPETYLRGLAEGLHREFPELRLTIATTVSGAAALRASGWDDWAELVALPCEDGQRLRRQWAEQVLLPRLARRLKADLVHSTASVAPIRAGVPHVITLHDVTFVVRRTFGRVTTWGMTQVITRAARNADGLVTGAAAARDEISAVLELEPDCFEVVPHGFGRAPQEPSLTEPAARAKFGLGDGPVVLCVGAKRPHKNQEVLIRALPAMPGVTLVLAGHGEAYEDELRALALAEGVGDRVVLLGYLPAGEIESLWALAACTALPTLGEGFGLPLLEALSRGVAIAASDIPVLREIGGDLPHWFDPHDPADARRALNAAMNDREISIAGPRHASSFTWERSARGTMAAYALALRPHGDGSI